MARVRKETQDGVRARGLTVQRALEAWLNGPALDHPPSVRGGTVQVLTREAHRRVHSYPKAAQGKRAK